MGILDKLKPSITSRSPSSSDQPRVPICIEFTTNSTDGNNSSAQEGGVCTVEGVPSIEDQGGGFSSSNNSNSHNNGMDSFGGGGGGIGGGGGFEEDHNMIVMGGGGSIRGMQQQQLVRDMYLVIVMISYRLYTL